MDEFTEVTSQGWFSRITESIKGVLVGLLLFLLSFGVLWWNEGRAVSAAKSLDEGAASIVSVSPEKIDAVNEGKLVHVTGVARTEDVLKDPDFGVSQKAITLSRQVEMYQWVENTKTEKKKKLGGGEETKTVYRYQKQWASQRVDSSEFRKPKGHGNPPLPYDNYTKRAQTVTLGSFSLAESAVKKIGGEALLNLDATALETVTPSVRGHTEVRDGAFYVHAASRTGSPQLGDVRVRFKVAIASEISIAARQAGNALRPWPSKQGELIELVEMGRRTPEAMFHSAKQSAATLTWILRLGGFLMMAFGVGLVFRPLAVVADAVPFFGELLRVGTFFISLAISLPLSLLTIGLAWVTARPLIGILFLAAVVGMVAGLVMWLRKRKAVRVAAPAG
jgi:hypothetical protein